MAQGTAAVLASFALAVAGSTPTATMIPTAWAVETSAQSEVVGVGTAGEQFSAEEFFSLTRSVGIVNARPAAEARAIGRVDVQAVAHGWRLDMLVQTAAATLFDKRDHERDREYFVRRDRRG